VRRDPKQYFQTIRRMSLYAAYLFEIPYTNNVAPINNASPNSGHKTATRIRDALRHRHAKNASHSQIN
jgi:hypothetical protein